MPWWGSESIASQFATAVNNAFGFPNEDYAGPFFGHRLATGGTSVGTCHSTIFNDIRCGSNWGPLNATYTFAQADLVPPVPGPLPLFGAAAAFGFSRKLRQRIKAGSNSVSSSYSL
jgi:hypothetical protein